MSTHCKITVIGNIGDAQAATSKAGKPYLRLSVAVDDPDGDTTTWYSCIITGRKAENPENLLRVFKKGRLVLCEGRPSTSAYLKKDGSPAVSNSILVDHLPVLLDPKPKD